MMPSGVFETTEVTVSAEGSGKTIRLDISEGDRGNAGDTPDLIDTTQLYLSKLSYCAARKRNTKSSANASTSPVLPLSFFS